MKHRCDLTRVYCSFATAYFVTDLAAMYDTFTMAHSTAKGTNNDQHSITTGEKLIAFICGEKLMCFHHVLVATIYFPVLTVSFFVR